ncbi:hypothetical protein CG709_03115 [Lachnotalea glycerini]|nr:hypothetical protein CG709_03115 [Lachnotalea glycerini]
MKLKAYIMLLNLLFILALSACSTNKINSTTNSSKSSTITDSAQMNDVSTSESAADTSYSEDEDPSPANAYKAVLQNEVSFLSTEDNHEFSLKEFLEKNSEYEGSYKVTNFTVIDMDKDQIPEVVLELSLGDSPEQYEILHYINGMVYGYNFVYRGFEMPKEDGTYSYADSAADAGINKILNFNSDTVETETLGYSQADLSGDDAVVSYFINNASVTEDDYNAFCDQQNEKKDVQWYELSDENIETIVSMDFNTNS